MEPTVISAIVIAVLSAIGTIIIGLCKVITRSSCCWNFIDIINKDEADRE